MISYVQPGFQHPAFVLDPIPSVAEYLANYEDLNEEWYRSFAAPLEGGGWGARASSFERRGLPPEPAPSEVMPDPQALPPIIQPGPGEDTQVLAGDRPLGALIRDPAEMTNPEVTAELEHLAGPGGYLGSAGAFAAGPGTGLGFIAGPMARSRVRDRIEELAIESLMRGLSLEPVMADEEDRRGVSIARRGEPVIIPIPDSSGGDEGGDRGTDYAGPGEAGETWTGPGGVFV